MACVSDTEPEIRDAANDANLEFLGLVRLTTTELALKPILTVLTTEMQSEVIIIQIIS